MPLVHRQVHARPSLGEKGNVLLRVLVSVPPLLHLEEDSLLVEVGVAVRDAELVHLHVRPQVLDHLGVRRRQDLVARARQGCPRLGEGVEELDGVGGGALHGLHLRQHVPRQNQARLLGHAHLLLDEGVEGVVGDVEAAAQALAVLDHGPDAHRGQLVHRLEALHLQPHDGVLKVVLKEVGDARPPVELGVVQADRPLQHPRKVGLEASHNLLVVDAHGLRAHVGQRQKLLVLLLDQVLELGVDARQLALDRLHEEHCAPLHEVFGADGAAQSAVGRVGRKVGRFLPPRFGERLSIEGVLLAAVHHRHVPQLQLGRVRVRLRQNATRVRPLVH
mmetsp:Transcript_2552/g.5595  ORF Transcript_2552/g.5595 Transcript_2552/m.5595 type:complete len:333 (+) Transcript_2552:864-1862(+)